MPILNIQDVQPTGLASVNPSFIYILTSDTYAQVTATGYLTKSKQEGFTFSNSQMALVYTTDDGPVLLKVVITYSGSSVLNTVVSLIQISSPGDVILPTTASYIAVFSDTNGTLRDDVPNAINPGNIVAGIPGTAGTFISFPPTPVNGSLVLKAIDAGGAFDTTISNSAIGQSTVYTMPNAANAVARFVVGATATPFVSGNFPVASGTGGLMVDSGLAATNIQNKTNIKAANTANIGGGGAGPISVVVAGLTSASKIVATIASSSNIVAVGKCIATATGFDITFTGDPGASCVVNYVAFVVGQ